MPLEKLKDLQNLSKRVREKEKSVFDIVLFGSSIKEKSKPEDIDICIIFSRQLNQDEIKRVADNFRECHVEHLFLSELYKEPLWHTLIHEGYSLTENRFLHGIFGFKSEMLFTYSLGNLAAVKKSMFSHALFGRDGKSGVLCQVKGKMLGRGCILVPVQSSEKIREFLEIWEVEYSVMKMMVA